MRLRFYLVEGDAAGNWSQRGIHGKSGTTGWTTLSLTYTSSPAAAKAYFKSEDLQRLRDGVDRRREADRRVQQPRSGGLWRDGDQQRGSADTGGQRQRPDLSAKYTSVGSAIAWMRR